MKHVVLFVASRGFQAKEYLDTKQALELNGIQVETGSDQLGEVVASDGTVAQATTCLELCDPATVDGVFFIGGPGALACLDNQEANRVLNECLLLKKSYGAICIAPRILAKANVLIGKQATGWDQDGELSVIFANNQVIYKPEAVVVDGNVVTANGPEAATAFGEAISQLLNV